MKKHFFKAVLPVAVVSVSILLNDPLIYAAQQDLLAEEASCDPIEYEETAAESEDTGDMPHYSDDFGLLDPPGFFETHNGSPVSQESGQDDGRSEIFSPDRETNANVIHYPITANNNISSFRYPANSYTAYVPSVILFRDYKGFFNVATYGVYDDGVWTTGYSVTKYDPVNFKLFGSLTIKPGNPDSYTSAGNITCDDAGYYYAVWGASDPGDGDKYTICVSKYDHAGNLVRELELKGAETYPYSGGDWGTRYAFNAGNCAVAINNGVLAINYARTMYNGHQSNMMLYIKTSDMSRIEGGTVYTSHSFDERIYPTGNDGFIVANHGDAYNRGFDLGVAGSNGSRFNIGSKKTTFHFREGMDRSYGYNETYAQLGGIAELDDAYVFAASSERELSLEPAPFMGYYGHYGPRDLFVQILKKDFYENSSDYYKVSGETRKTTGTKPETANTELRLNGDEVDEGIIWITSYDDEHYAAHPKIVTLTEDTYVLLWEKLSYSDGSAETYYMIMDTQGNIVADQMKIGGCNLAADIDPIVYNGEVYWATVDMYGEQIHRLNVSNSFSGVDIIQQPYVSSVNKNSDGSYGIEITVKATNASSYKWYVSNDGLDWSEAGGTGVSGQATDKLVISDYSDGSPAFYRCSITDASGQSVISNTAVEILKEPDNGRGKSGDTAVFEVKAIGGSSYRWYGLNENDNLFSISGWKGVAGIDSPKLTMEINRDSGAYRYVCCVRSSDGQEIYSEPVSIRRDLTILKQPENAYGKRGEYFTITFTPDGEGVTYQWYMKYGNDQWLKITGDLGTFTRLTWEINDMTLNSKFKCVVTDKYGASMETDVVGVYEAASFGIDKHEITLVSRPGSSEVIKPILVNPYEEDTLIWSSSNEAVATVDKGVVTAVEGLEETKIAMISVKTPDGLYEDSCKITVVPMPKAGKPVADHESGDIGLGSTVILSTDTSGAKIYYTTDDTAPGVDDTGKMTGTTCLYGEGIEVNKDIVIRAIAVKKDYKPSDEARYVYRAVVDWGDIRSEKIRTIFSSPSDIPSGVWYLYGNENTGYTRLSPASGTTPVSYTYTGNKISFDDEILVFHGKRLLSTNTDYSINYVNNVDAAGPTAQRSPAFIVKGKGNYDSSATFPFTVVPRSIREAAVNSSRKVVLTSGSKLGGLNPEIVFNGKKLKKGKDYLLNIYKESVSPDNLVRNPSQTAIGTGEIYLCEISAVNTGNFSGTMDDVITVEGIAGKDPSVLNMNNAKVTLPKLQWTGSPISVKGLFEGANPQATVNSGKNRLVYGRDFYVDDVSYTDAGKYSFRIHGTADVMGGLYCTGDKLCTLEIAGIQAGKVKKACVASNVEYTGKALTPGDLYLADKSGYGEITLYTEANKVKHPLKSGVDYDIHITGHGAVGKCQAVFVLKGQYTGTIAQNINIKPYDIKKDKANKIRITVLPAVYKKSGAVPSVKVYCDGTLLAEGLDYKLKFKNNNKVAASNVKGAPEVSISGIGNYTGTAAVPFTISKADVTANITLFSQDKVYKENAAAGYFKSAPKLYDGDKNVDVGKGKDITSIVPGYPKYYYASDGKEISDSSVVPAGTVIMVKTMVTCAESSVYNEGTYEVTGYYKVIDKDNDIGKASVKIKNPESIVYDSCKRVRITKADNLTVTLNKQDLKDDEYSIVSVRDNILPGSAKVTIKGEGIYGGRKTFSVKINKRSMKN